MLGFTGCICVLYSVPYHHSCDLRVGQPAVEVVDHQLRDTSVAEALPRVYLCLGTVTQGAPVVAWAQYTKVGDYWRRGGCTSRGAGVRAVRTTPDQYNPRFVE